jgi:hypothetical protein
MRYGISELGIIDIESRYINASAAKPQYHHPRSNLRIWSFSANWRDCMF